MTELNMKDVKRSEFARYLLDHGKLKGKPTEGHRISTMQYVDEDGVLKAQAIYRRKSPVVYQVRKSKVDELIELIDQPYAWPGGYPKHMVCADGERVCMGCVKENRAVITESTMNAGTDVQWEFAHCDIIWEGMVHCDHCGHPIPAAYGETD